MDTCVSFLHFLKNCLIFITLYCRIKRLNDFCCKEVATIAKCYLTGKTTVTGNKRSHALNATRRTWKANLQTVHIKDENGNVKKVKISARALKKAKIERA